MGWGTHFDDARRTFHLALVEQGTRDTGPVMCVARRAEDVVGVLYGFRFANSYSYFQTGWSKEFVKQSLGSVLVAHTMEWASSNGLRIFDFLRGDDEYKRRFGATPRGDETWMLTRGAAGRAIRARQVLAGLVKRGES
jgi:CelD/BcsL family acetyltransferase involved in cellulose biosynthesis